MNELTVDLLRCPDCASESLTLSDVFGRSGGEIVYGGLTCSGCQRWFPIIEKILVLAPAALRSRSDEERLVRATRNERLMARFADVGPRSERDASRIENQEMQFWNEGKWLEEPSKNWFRTLSRQRHLFSTIDYSRSNTILELGAGFANDLFEVLERFERGTHYVATDLSFNALASISNRFDRLGSATILLDLVVCVAGDAPFRANRFDYVVALGILHHTPEMHAAVPSVTRMLRRGGKLLLMEPRDRKSLLGKVFRRTFPLLGLKESEHEERVDFDKLNDELRKIGTIEAFHGETSPIVPLITVPLAVVPFTELGARLLLILDQLMIGSVGRVLPTFSYGEGLFVVRVE